MIASLISLKRQVKAPCRACSDLGWAIGQLGSAEYCAACAGCGFAMVDVDSYDSGRARSSGEKASLRGPGTISGFGRVRASPRRSSGSMVAASGSGTAQVAASRRSIGA